MRGTDNSTARKGITVAPSPFNEIKLDLGVILVIGLLLLLVQERIVDGLLPQLVLLLSYGLAGMVWLVVRTFQVVARLKRGQE